MTRLICTYLPDSLQAGPSFFVKHRGTLRVLHFSSSSTQARWQYKSYIARGLKNNWNDLHSRIGRCFILYA